MSRLADKAWKLFEEGADYETVKTLTHLSDAVLTAMQKDVERAYADKHRRESRQ